MSQPAKMKEETEFHLLDNIDWKPVTSGIRAGMAWERILSWDPGTGAHSRIYRLEPGCETEEVLTHDFWEEVYILEGSLVDRRLGNKEFVEGSYACRPPGMVHGPYSSPKGCRTFEVRYYSRD